jgi:curved DNA-binding protein CbpA
VLFRLVQGPPKITQICAASHVLNNDTTRGYEVRPTYLASRSVGARFRTTMATAVQPGTGPTRDVCQRVVLRTLPRGSKTECILADGTSILVSNFLASFIRPGDELRFPLASEAANAGTEIYIRNPNPETRKRDSFQAQIGYATQPRKDRRNNLFVSAKVVSRRLGISAIHIRCEALRDYFYVGNRRRPWNRQPSFYELLRVTPNVSPAELRLAFKLRSLELRAARAPAGDLRTLERAFNILAAPELRACYDSLLADPEAPALFPYGGFGSLLVAGDLSRDGTAFYASRLLSFLPDQSAKDFRAPLRKFTFCDDRAIYRDSRRKLEVLFDQASLPLLWDSTWNQWKHLLGAEVGVKAAFVQSGKYRHRSGAWHLVKWETALPSRIEIALPANLAEQIAEAHKTHQRFGQFAEALDEIRLRIESAPVEQTDLQKLCANLRLPGDFDVALITWRPDYHAFYYRQLLKRARRLFLFRSEYIFDLETVVIAETPQLGHATYLFSKPANMTEFLALYSRVTKDDIRHNCGNVAEKLGFLGRLIHGVSPRSWLRELKARLGETVDHLEASN